MTSPLQHLKELPVARSEVLGTAECLRISAEINSFENNFFGADFIWSAENTETWLRAGSLFYAAVCQKEPNGNPRIAAVGSILLTGERSCARLLAGEIREQELVPWFLDSENSAPILYFSSVITDTTDHLLSVYGNLVLDVEAYLKAKQLRIYQGYSIAIGGGFQHLSKNGFSRIDGPRYLQKYDFMRIDARSAKTEFWRRLLSFTPSDCEAKEIEARLRVSKAERYRELYGAERPASN